MNATTQTGAPMTDGLPATRIPKDQGDVATVAALPQFEQTVRRILTANGGPRMHRWPVQGDMPGAERIGVVFIGPELDVDAMTARAEQVNQAHPGIYLVLVSDPRPGLFERALRAGVRDVLSPTADESAISDVIARGFDHASRWRSAAPTVAEDPNATKKRIVTILAPKGGIGKSFLAVNLAASLNITEPGKVALVDMDLQFGDVAGALNIGPEHTLIDAVRATQGADPGAVNALVKAFLTRHESGLFVMCGPEEPADADEISYEQSVRLTKSLATSFDTLIVDTCAGLDPHALSVAEISTDLVFVCSVDVSSVRALRREIDTLDRLGMSTQKRHLVINRSDSPGGARTEDVEAAVGMKASVLIPHDKNVMASANQGIPITVADPKALVARRVNQLVEELLERDSSAQEAKESRPFWKRTR